jgi:hypothetical protein
MTSGPKAPAAPMPWVRFVLSVALVDSLIWIALYFRTSGNITILRFDGITRIIPLIIFVLFCSISHRVLEGRAHGMLLLVLTLATALLLSVLCAGLPITIFLLFHPNAFS